MAKKKPPEPAWDTVLKAFSAQYFAGVKKDITFDDAAYWLATWLHDHTNKTAFLRMIERLPQVLWVEAVRKWANGKHDR